MGFLGAHRWLTSIRYKRSFMNCNVAFSDESSNNGRIEKQMNTIIFTKRQPQILLLVGCSLMMQQDDYLGI